MKQLFKRGGAALLALLLLFTAAGCGAGGQSPSPTGTAMGRYVETERPLPAPFFEIIGFQSTGDGTLHVMGYVGNAGEQIHLAWYDSADGGRTWEEQTHAGLAEFDRADRYCHAVAAAWAGDGTCYVYLSDSAEDGTQFQYMARADAGGALTDLGWDVPAAPSGSGLRAFRVADSGDFLAGRYEDVVQLDGATGAEKGRYFCANTDWADGWAVSGDTLAFSEGGRVVFYSLETGKSVSELSASAPAESSWTTTDLYRVMAPGPEVGFYFADPTGVYRALPGSSVAEQVADGGLNSLSTPSLMRMDLAAAGDEILLLGYRQNSYVLLCYAYDPDVPTLPGRELAVYTLYDNPLVRQAAGQFQLSHPEVHVDLRVGAAEDGSVTREDALRALATELSAGKGPDVLVLDGLPVTSYIEKGVLADLSDTVSGADLLENITEAYRQADGALPAVPAQFQVPLLHGEDAAGLAGLEALADRLEAERGSYNHPLTIVRPGLLLDFFLPVCAPGFVGADGAVDREGLSGFLSALGRIMDLERGRTADDGYNGDDENIFNFGALLWKGTGAALDVGNLTVFHNLYPARQADEDTGRGEIVPIFGQNAYLPRTVMGVNSQSREGELAMEFIAAALSYDTQKADLEGGMPVNARAFEASTQVEARDAAMRTGEDGRVSFSYYAMYLTDAEGASAPVELYVNYPGEAWRAEMAQRLRGLDTPLVCDESLLQIIRDGAAAYLDGGGGLESTVDALMEKLRLYAVE